MDAVGIHLLDGPDVSQMERLLHLKVEVFLLEDEVDLLAIPAGEQRDVTNPSLGTGTKPGLRKPVGLSLRRSFPTCSGRLGPPSPLSGCVALRQTPEDQVWASGAVRWGKKDRQHLVGF